MSGVPALLLMFSVGSYALIVACGLFAATILYGIHAGDALPTATIFRLVQMPAWAVIESLAEAGSLRSSVQRLVRLLRDLPAPIRRSRLDQLLTLVIGTIAGWEGAPDRGETRLAIDALAADLVATTVALLSAPVTTRPVTTHPARPVPGAAP